MSGEIGVSWDVASMTMPEPLSDWQLPLLPQILEGGQPPQVPPQPSVPHVRAPQVGTHAAPPSGWLVEDEDEVAAKLVDPVEDMAADDATVLVPASARSVVPPLEAVLVAAVTPEAELSPSEGDPASSGELCGSIVPHEQMDTTRTKAIAIGLRMSRQLLDGSISAQVFCGLPCEPVSAPLGQCRCPR
jgi:hypothetical protein